MYLFETLPISIPRGDLRTVQALILHFIWVQKRHIKNLSKAPKSHGGPAAPDILNITGPCNYIECLHGPLCLPIQGGWK